MGEQESSKPVEFDFDAWSGRLIALVDEAVAAGKLGKMILGRDATDERPGFKLAIVWPGQQPRRRKRAL